MHTITYQRSAIALHWSRNSKIPTNLIRTSMKKSEPEVNLSIIQDKLTDLYRFESYHIDDNGFEDESITVLGVEFEKLENITRADVESWYNSGISSAFGNVAAQETQHDDQVRSSRELDATKFSIEQETLDFVADDWGQYFLPAQVRVEPYKLIVYGPGDHFSWHKDTPEENLCGTVLISLFQDCEPAGAFEIIKSSGGSETWSSKPGNCGWCGFYPDTPHRVNQLKSGFRAILSFKIFVEEPCQKPWGEKLESKLVNDIIDDLQKVQGPIGILLKHHYGYDSKTIYGCDKLLLENLDCKGLHVEIMPVLVRFNAEYWIGDTLGKSNDPKFFSSVYSITDDALSLVRKRLSQQADNKRPSKKLKTIPIAFLDGVKNNCSGLWEQTVQEASEYNGNEAVPGTENSVYVRYAAVVNSK